MRILLTVSLFCFFLFACKSKKDKKPDGPVVVNDSTNVTVTPVQANKDSVLVNLTNKVLSAIKNSAYDSLVLLFHPNEGVRFSPHAYVDTIRDIKFKAGVFITEAAAPQQRKMVWGEFDGSGDLINYTINEYFREFVYDVDFLQPETRKVNAFIGGGNSQNNLLTVYAGCDFTESHFSGFDKKLEGNDWRSLRLVFKLKEGQYYLVGIIHDEWTI